MKNIGTEVNKDIFLALYAYLYDQAVDSLKETQFVILDSEMAEPAVEVDFRDRLMVLDDTEHPILQRTLKRGKSRGRWDISYFLAWISPIISRASVTESAIAARKFGLSATGRFSSEYTPRSAAQRSASGHP
jgi:hypothetical protein